MSAEMWDRGAQSEREMEGSREKEDSRVGGLTVDCNNRTHEGALQSEAPFSAQTWYASGAVFMQLGKAMRARGFQAGSTWCCRVCCCALEDFRKSARDRFDFPN